MRLLWIVPFLALTGNAFAQDAAKPATSEAAAPQSNQTAATVDIGPDLDQATEKTNIYVSLYNRSARGVDSWERYKSWVDLKKGITGKERYVSYGLYSLYDDVTKKLVPEAREAAQNMAPKLPALDQAALSYTKALEALHPIVSEANAYYERQDYRDDNFVKAKEMHPKLVAAFETFVVERHKFDVELTAVKNVLDEKVLAEIEKTEGRKYAWQKKRVMMVSSRIMDLANSDKPDVAKLDEAVKSYAQIVREFDDYVRSADDVGHDTISSYPASILSKLRDYRDALQKKNQRQAVQALNSALSDYNTMVTFAR